MDAHNAAEVLEFLEQRGLEVYVDGGWAVDGGQMDLGRSVMGFPPWIRIPREAEPTEHMYSEQIRRMIQSRKTCNSPNQFIK